ncbi:MAG: vWA domain-containing protein, partial [Planctomycetota bacterium]
MSVPPIADEANEPQRAVPGRLADAGAWLGSVAFHAAGLATLALLTQFTPIDRIPELLSPTLPEPAEEAIEEAFRVAEELTVDVGALADGGVGDAAASAPIEADVSEVSLELEALTEVAMTAALDLPATALTSPDPDDLSLVHGVGATGATGSRGAVDRLTAEILQSIEQRPTLVVWLFDRSGSLDKQRERVADRFERVYRELGVARSRGAAGFGAEDAESRDPDDEPLLTTVAAFAEGVEYLTPKPTADVEAIQSAVRAIRPDRSGRENVFSAVIDAVNRHRNHVTRRPRRNVMLVVFTDEAGDDAERLDAAVQATRAWQTPVYVVGAPAPFGRVDAYVRYVDPDPEFDQSVQWLPVRQGPESLRPERLRLGFFGRGDFDGPTLDSG